MPEPDPQPRRSAGQRLVDSLMRPSRAQVVVAVLLAGVGFAGVTQVRANDLDTTYAGKRQQDLIDLWSSLSAASQRAQREIAGLEQTRNDLNATSSRREAAITAAQQSATNLEILAGTVPVRGPGIRIVITERDGAINLNHLLDMVQELRTAQAEAMEFNDQVRVIAQTSFAESSSGVLVDGRALESPYVVDVIGDPEALTEALRFPEGPVASMRDDDGAEVVVEQRGRIDIQAVADTAAPNFAEPDEGQ